MGDSFQVQVVSTGLDEDCEIPTSLHLYPNPAQGVTNLEYSVQSPGVVRLEIYDLLGKRVAIPVNEYRIPGEYIFQFDTDGFESGLYVCEMVTSYSKTTVKLMVE